MRQMIRLLVWASMFGVLVAPGQAADLDYGTPRPVYSGGVACDFEDWGPDISLPWRSVWLGHFSGGRVTPTASGNELEWKNEHVCFPSQASCNRWVSANRRAFHHPEGFWTCLPIR